MVKCITCLKSFDEKEIIEVEHVSGKLWPYCKKHAPVKRPKCQRCGKTQKLGDECTTHKYSNVCFACWKEVYPENSW